MIRDGSDVGRFASWLLTSRIVFVACTVLGLVLVVSQATSYMFNRLYDADVAKARTLGQMEDVNRRVSLGRLAAGVAHEINNPLGVIKESAGFIQDLIGLGAAPAECREIEEQADAITESVSRCAEIARLLLSFSRQSGTRPSLVDLEKLIRDVLRFHGKEAEIRGILVVVDIGEESRLLHSDRGKLQEVLLNLVSNAFDAMLDGGTLRIATRATGQGEISIEISDTGCGIPDDVRKSLFEPFFTTKPEGMGTGLGLSITYGLVSRLKGRISVESRVGEGSIFTVVLPTRIQEGSEA